MSTAVITLVTNADGEIVTDATGALLTTDAECARFPHLSARNQHALADFDRRVNTAALPLDSDGHPHIPASAESWMQDNVSAHVHYL